MNKTYSVYTLASRSRNLYTGVTGNLERRMLEHRQSRVCGFTARFKIFRLVHWESFGDIRAAIAREKEIKGWRRQKKIRLIEEANPAWEDLASQLPHTYLPHQWPKADSLTPFKKQIRTGFGMTWGQKEGSPEHRNHTTLSFQKHPPAEPTLSFRTRRLLAGEESASLLTMAMKTIDQIFINSPYSEPAEHWKYDRESRLFSRVAGARRVTCGRRNLQKHLMIQVFLSSCPS
jgi:putative endonuclease